MTTHDAIAPALIADLRALAEATASEAAAALVAARLRGVQIAGTKSNVLDLVTEADRESERLIRDRLLGARPDDGFLGEEGVAGQSEGSSGITWVVDPLDGTVNYLYGSSNYAVSIAAVDREGQAVAGAIVLCPSGERYTAGRGCGATRDGVEIRVGQPESLALSLVASGLAYGEGLRAEQLSMLMRLAPRVRDLRMGGSAAAELCRVAEGGLDAYLESGLGPWDYAAGALLVTEAGGWVGNGSGGHADGTQLIACAPEIADPLLAQVRG